MTTNLYEFIKKRCEALGMTMSQLQDKTGLSWGILSGIKNGKGIRAGTKQKLAEGLLCSIGDIQAALSLDAAAQKKKVEGEEDMKAYPVTPEPVPVMETVDRLEQMVQEEYPEEIPEKVKSDSEKRPKMKKQPEMVPRDPKPGEFTAVEQPVILPVTLPTQAKPIYPGGVDNVNHPDHYTQGGIECIDAIKAAMTPEAFCGFLKGNVQKYIWRYEKKNGLEDLKKARWYLDRLIREMGGNDAKTETDPDT